MGRVKILKASAGSGKTYRLAYEYIRSVIDSPQLYRHILAVTFTNKATEEMKQRIVGELNALANGSPSGYMGDLERDLGLDGQTIRRRAADARTKILHDYSRFTVLTIDKFFQRIIRSFIKELGIDLNFNLELQTDSILDSATDRLIDRILAEIPYTRLNGHRTQRLPGNCNISFRFIEGESLLLALDLKGIAGSSGSACTSGSLDPSHVLLAIGLPHEIAHGSLRLSLSEENTIEQADRVVDALKEIVARLRSMSPLYDDFLREGENEGQN